MFDFITRPRQRRVFSSYKIDDRVKAGAGVAGTVRQQAVSRAERASFFILQAPDHILWIHHNHLLYLPFVFCLDF